MFHTEEQFGIVVDLTVWLGSPLMAGFLAWYGMRLFWGPAGGMPTRWKTGLRFALVFSAALGGLWIARNLDLGVPATDFAPGYTRQRFNQVRVGDSEARVKELLGEPIRVMEYEEVGIAYWYFSWPRTTSAPGVGSLSNNYWKRTVALDMTSRHVVRKHCQFAYRG